MNFKRDHVEYKGKLKYNTMNFKRSSKIIRGVIFMISDQMSSKEM